MQKRIVILSLAGLFLAASVFAAWPAYRHWQEKRAVARANLFLSQNDFRQAWLCAGQALQLNPRNLEACRAMARISERTGDPAAALEWKTRVAALDPSLDNELELAASALQVETPPWRMASAALKRAESAGQGSPGWHVLSAQLAMQQGDLRQAEAHFETASRLDPAQRAHGLNLAALRLSSTNGEARAATQRQLGVLAEDPKLGTVALAWLVRDAVEHRNPPAALRYSSQLVNRRDATLADRLEHARLLRQTGPNARAQSYLALVQASATTNAAEVHSISAWMIEQGLASDALKWLTDLPLAAQQESPVRLAAAECYAAREDWAALEQAADKQNWSAGEFLRRAYLARAAAGLKRAEAAEAQWRLAVHDAWGSSLGMREPATGEAGRIMALVTLARQWGWDKRRESLLWELARKSGPALSLTGAGGSRPQSWALRQLEQSYSASGDTAALARVYELLAALEPDNVVARNNLAGTWLLLGANLEQAHKLAAELCAAHPGEPVIAATRAYSLHLQARTREGLALLEALGEVQRREPAVALYYGLLLQADQQTQKAAPYLALAGTGHLLPEEKKLLHPYPPD